MPIRRLHILVILVALAFCRLLHDSLPAPAPAAEISAVASVQAPTTLPAIRDEDLNWLSLAPATIDAPPAPPATQPSEPVMQWVMVPTNLPRFVVQSNEGFSPAPPAAPAIRLAALVSDEDPIRSMDIPTYGSTAPAVSPRHAPVIEPEAPPLQAPPPLVVDTTLPPPDPGGASLPPVLSPPPALSPPPLSPPPVLSPPPLAPGIGSTPLPVPEPAVAEVLMLAVVCRTSMRQRRAL